MTDISDRAAPPFLCPRHNRSDTSPANLSLHDVTAATRLQALPKCRASPSWDGLTLSTICKKPFDMLVEGLIVRNGGADTPLYTNFRRFWRNVGKFTTKESTGRLFADLVRDPLDGLRGELAAA